MNRDELKALAWYERTAATSDDSYLKAIVEAARWAASFPTDEQVETVAKAFCTPEAHALNPYPEGFQTPCVSHFVDARAALGLLLRL
jgi:hypothetical protein